MFEIPNSCQCWHQQKRGQFGSRTLDQTIRLIHHDVSQPNAFVYHSEAKFYQLSWQEYHDTLFPCSFSFLQKFKPQRDTDNLASQPSVPAGDTIHDLGHLSRKPVKIHWHHLPAKLSQFFSSTAFEFSHRPWTRTTHTINTADTASQLQITTTSCYQWTCFERCLLD